MAYTSSSTPNVDENKSQTINVNPTDFRNATGYWKIKIKGTKTGDAHFDFKADLVEFRTSKNNGTSLTFENGGSLTAHLVSIWVNTLTNHQRYEINTFIESGATTSYNYSSIILPDTSCKIKVSTERGNIAVFSGS
jgi:hypothetical protein